MRTVAGSDHLDQLSTRVGTGVWTQDLSDESLAPYCSELSGQPLTTQHYVGKKYPETAADPTFIQSLGPSP